MKREKVKCEKCGVYISKSNMSRHIGSKTCIKNTNINVVNIENYKNEVNEKYKCPYCEKEFTKNGIGTHIWRMHGEGKNFNPNKGYKDGSRTTWNKGLTKETNDIINKSSIKLSERYKKGELIGSFTGKKHSKKFKEKMSKIAINKGFGGVTQSRWIKYKGKTLGSSYELKVVKDLDKNNIKWDTCNRFPYIDNKGKLRTYTPDIYLIDYDIYLEPKNDFLIENINPNLGFKDIEKIKWCEEQNNIKVILLNKEQLNWEYIKLIIETGTRN